MGADNGSASNSISSQILKPLPAIMKTLLTTIIIVFTFNSCYSQDKEIPNLIGNWYMVNRSGLIEFSITKDSIKTRKVYSDLTPKEKRVQSFSYLKTVKLIDRILIVFKTDSLKYSAMTIMNINEKKHFQLVWNSIDTSVNDIETLIEINKNDNKQLFGYYVFSEHYIDTLHQMKSIDSLSLSDFKII